jgi:hypothetical protein
VRLRVLASEYDGRDWARLSADSELLEIPGDHFDLVTVRIDDLAANLRSWLRGDGSVGLTERRSLAPAMSNDEIAPPLAGAAKNESLSRRLRRFFDYKRGSVS